MTNLDLQHEGPQDEPVIITLPEYNPDEAAYTPFPPLSEEDEAVLQSYDDQEEFPEPCFISKATGNFICPGDEEYDTLNVINGVVWR